jgi:hypothetical protein
VSDLHVQFCGDEWFSADGDEADEIRLWDDDTPVAVVVYVPVPDEPNVRGTYTITNAGTDLPDDMCIGWRSWQGAMMCAATRAGYMATEVSEAIS